LLFTSSPSRSTSSSTSLASLHRRHPHSTKEQVEKLPLWVRVRRQRYCQRWEPPVPTPSGAKDPSQGRTGGPYGGDSDVARCKHQPRCQQWQPRQ
jgi:hypothetical protein